MKLVSSEILVCAIIHGRRRESGGHLTGFLDNFRPKLRVSSSEAKCTVLSRLSVAHVRFTAEETGWEISETSTAACY